MKYQLILQWAASSIESYDTLIAIEDILIENINDGSEVDGHDAGAGEMNIFIDTDNPKVTFTAVKKLLSTEVFWVDIRVAYRATAGDKYTILWPENLHKFNVA